MGGPNIIPLPHIYGARIKGVEVFCPLDPPPPYEAVVNQTDRPQESSFQMSGGSEAARSPMEQDCVTMTQDGDIPNIPGEESASTSTANSNQRRAVERRGLLRPLRRRSRSDPLFHRCSVERGEAIPQAPLRACICLQVPGGSGGGGAGGGVVAAWDPEFEKLS
ncbi:family with sequence similarity 189 member A2 [Phyllostomus discolor]|uniref:Family with sequence similarity 189 member A2 n=1 Tax=Phyllostomus discolor TaxID=89673 RepID=A0A834B180_9CHIR|nr:family with sequence similarity 189 member A2 [Phyllostomus discolor]